MIAPVAAGGRGMDAQWDDDVHHALHAALTGERQGYYCDFGPLSVLAKVLTSAFFHDGTYSAFRRSDWGHPVDRAATPGWRFVVCLQNHDQVGNRAAGERLPELTSPELLRVGAVLLLTSPFTPLLWMGEEWAASTRWPFFTSHPEPGLARVTGEGRVAEFEGHGWDVGAMIDPQDPAAYREAVLDWDEPRSPGHRDVLALYRRLIALRAAEPDLRDGDLAAVAVDYRDDADRGERWLVVRRGAFRVAANLAGDPCPVPVDADEVVLASADGVRLSADGVVLPAESAAVLRDRPREPRSRAGA
jgi:maltooligosyltrehalose trehalohydrolase